MNKDARIVKAAEHWSKINNRQIKMSRWWQHPRILQHINKTVCGEELAGPGSGLLKKLEKYIDCHSNKKIKRAISVGCGTGVKEMRLISSGLVESFDLFEISESRISAGKELALKNGINDVVTFYSTDPFSEISTSQYDMVYWDNALHHMFDVFFAVKWSYDILKKDGFFVMDDFVGPSRFQWTQFNIDIANRIRKILPDRIMYNSNSISTPFSKVVGKPRICDLMNTDPTEAADSERIISAVKQYFSNAEIILTGGSVYHLCLNDILSNFDDTCDSVTLELLLLLDDMCIKNGDTHYAVAFATKN